MEQQKMISVAIPEGEFVRSPRHCDPALLLTEEQARELRDNLSARLEEV